MSFLRVTSFSMVFNTILGGFIFWGIEDISLFCMPSFLTLLFKANELQFFSNLVNIAVLFFVYCILRQIYWNFVESL